MKKTYINPTIDIVKIQTMQMIAISGPNVTSSEYDPSEDGEFIGAHGDDFDWDEEEY